LLDRLESMGVRVAVGHAAENVGEPELVVATSAARPDNPELLEAGRRGIPIVKRAEMLGWLMDESYGLAVAGTHGKTSTTAMLAYILHRAGLDPTAMIGGEPLDFPSHGLLGRSRYLVAEADEYDRSFLRLWPKVSIITSIEADHLDCYADLADIAATFEEFASRVPDDGLLVTCADDGVLRHLQVDVPRQSYGFAPDSDWRITAAEPLSPHGTRFGFATPGGATHHCHLLLSGNHYVLNALAAIAAAAHVGVAPEDAAEILGSFRGTRRRFEVVGEADGVVVVDDYGHHPTEARATLRAARERHRGEIWCVFQPHTVNRTERLLDEFLRAFSDADHALILPIYHPAGREQEEQSITSDDLVRQMKHPDARAPRSFEDALAILEAEADPGSMVITMGAGDVYKLGSELLTRLRRRAGRGA
jgi:UDP-N-acetylmuramate--alanine ligase